MDLNTTVFTLNDADIALFGNLSILSEFEETTKNVSKPQNHQKGKKWCGLSLNKNRKCIDSDDDSSDIKENKNTNNKRMSLDTLRTPHKSPAYKKLKHNTTKNTQTRFNDKINGQIPTTSTSTQNIIEDVSAINWMEEDTQAFMSNISKEQEKSFNPHEEHPHFELPNISNFIQHDNSSIITKNSKIQNDSAFINDLNSKLSKELFSQLPTNKSSSSEINSCNDSQFSTQMDSQFLKEFDRIVKKEETSKRNINAENEEDDKLWEKAGMTQLLTNDDYRQEVNLIFNKLESTICEFGNNKDNKENMNDSLANTFLLTKLTAMINAEMNAEDSAGGGINDTFSALLNLTENESNLSKIIKQALTENSKSKVPEPNNFLNASILKDQSQDNSTKVLGDFFHLPNKVKDLMKLYKGIDKLYDWQIECLSLPAVAARKNLIYALPTSGGKTLVAEVLMLREVLCRNKNVIFVLPYVSIVQEKIWALSPFAVALDFLLEEYAAGKGTYPPRKRRRKNSIYIATIEKALGLVNSLIETNRINELGLVVVDELHLVGDPSRGATLESLLTKLVYIEQEKRAVQSKIQIIGMSATIGNLQEICSFLKATLYTQNFRPVELIEYVKCEQKISKINYQSKDQFDFLLHERNVDYNYSKSIANIDPDCLGGLVFEVIPNASCLIFCSSKKGCENVAMLLCKVLHPNLKQFKNKEKNDLLKAMTSENQNLCHILSNGIPYGVGYHHSGLTTEERKLIEEGFRNGIICVICCTSTLAAGVNLPAKRVILRQPYIGREFINLSRYKQMVGRAGRAGFEEKGESILICKPHELTKVREMLKAPMDIAKSAMQEQDFKGLRQLILSSINLGLAKNRPDLHKIISNTLLSVQQTSLNINIKKVTDQVIVDLFKLGALENPHQNKNIKENSRLSGVSVEVNSTQFAQDSSSENGKTRISITNSSELKISPLGSAAIKAGLDLNKAHILFEDLLQASTSLVLVDCLHLMYLVTPYDLSEQIFIDKVHYYQIYSRLNEKAKQTAQILGLTEACAIKLLKNLPLKTISERVLNRFYVTLMLFDLWNEMSVYQVSVKYQINRGLIQNLMTGAASFASNVVHFCEEFEQFWPFAHLLKGMSQRLAHCCVKELIPLMELPSVKQSRARQLYNAGYKTLQSIAKADVNDLIEKIEFMSRKVANQLINASKMILLEKVENLREEAEDVLEGIDQQ